MSLAEWCQWLEQTPTSTAIAESIWLFPLIEGSHILTLPLSVGMIMIFDLASVISIGNIVDEKHTAPMGVRI